MSEQADWDGGLGWRTGMADWDGGLGWLSGGDWQLSVLAGCLFAVFVLRRASKFIYPE
ncbi:hypothetical protein [Neorhodopirellula lusitana]|uniref:hypothetical protein n=1 Tax=Neorhodopirellula lusitana TaxID=445327 RepID=UPI00384EE27F